MTRTIKQLSIRKTVFLAIVTGLMIAAISLLLGIDTNRRVDDLVQHIESYTETTARKRDLLSAITSEMGYGGAIHQFKNFVLRGDPDYIERFRQKAEAVIDAIEVYRKLGTNEEEAGFLARIESVMREYMAQSDIARRMVANGDTPRAIDAVVKVDDTPALAGMAGLTRALVAARRSHQANLTDDLHQLQQRAALSTFAAPAALLLLTALMVIAFLRIRNTLGGEPSVLDRITRRVAEGDLNVADLLGDEPRAGIIDSTLRSVETVSTVVDRSREISAVVNRSVDGIMERIEELCGRFKRQKENIRQTAATILEMTETTHRSTASAQRANELSALARRSSVHGEEVVEKAIAAMQQINDASRKIADITTVIDEIAFQTNLLALNAAVEAARAGEQGKGFAVVATEVRNLAQRSATAAKEIENLIEDSTSKVEDGTKLVNAAGEALKDIYQAVEKVDAVVAEMAASNKQQAAGIDEVNLAIGRIEAVRDQNERQVLDIARDCELLDHQAEALFQTIRFFRTGQRQEEEPPFEPERANGEAEPMEEEWAMPEPLPQPVLEQGPEEIMPPSATGWDGVERRSANRPWSHRMGGKTSAGHDQQDWEGF